MEVRQLRLSALARIGFTDLVGAEEGLAALTAEVGELDAAALFEDAGDPDAALRGLLELGIRAPGLLAGLRMPDGALERLVIVLGASRGLTEFLLRHPDRVEALRAPLTRLPARDEYGTALGAEVGVGDEAGSGAVAGEKGARALRIAYRTELLRIAAWDLSARDPLGRVEQVGVALADLAGAALDAALAVARADLVSGEAGLRYAADEVAATRLAIVGMGKAGAQELNYISDVDVIFVAEAAAAAAEEDELGQERMLQIATRLAIGTARVIDGIGVEPGLWEVDANLRPEGKDGALVRTLSSHVAYYDRWAHGWEFQALLKARPLAGDRELGEDYRTALAPLVWTSAGRDRFVESMQRMRERVTANIPPDELDIELKLGPGGLRDIEFTVQLLQLVHGRGDDRLRQRGTLPAIRALAEHGYIGRAEAVTFAEHYQFLRLLEHRVQLRDLRRTHLMPRDPDDLRLLARASGLARTGAEIDARWREVKRSVRELHQHIFYRPLLAALARIPVAEAQLSSEQAEARLEAVGFADPAGAARHIRVLTGGLSRSAAIQRTLLPALLQWFADGTDPDYGLLVFRRLSEALGRAPWYLRMLRDSTGAAERLARLLSTSRFVGELLETAPESALWLDDDSRLQPRTAAALADEVDGILRRHDSPDAAAAALRALRRREVLRTAMAAILDVIDVRQVGATLTAITSASLEGTLRAIRSAAAAKGGDGIEFAAIALGRYGGGELGFGSDADIVYVHRAVRVDAETAASVARLIIRELGRLTEDHRLPLDLDADLRPEGKNGPLARSLDAYRAYYGRWSLTWEAQALLRAHGVAGDPGLCADFLAMADDIRYPDSFTENEVREVRRIKARVENERLPQGADPARHLKLGRGSLSDVEWYVQLLQLQHARAQPALRTTSTLDALTAAQEHGLVGEEDADELRAAWLLASRVRSAGTLWTSRTSDVLPVDRRGLEGVARLLGYPRHSASALEQDYLAVTRRARRVFERDFYG